MKRFVIGIDTSCYTTSIACVSSEGIVLDLRTVLSVALGERGLRQSDAVFQHVRNLPALFETLFREIDGGEVLAVAVSTKPVDTEESYMPVFLAGKCAGSAIAGSLHIPVIETAHQIGHIRAALYGNESLMRAESFIALHLSGGTTDILSVGYGAGGKPCIDPIGGSDDLHAGQFVDRVGVAMGLPFPAGRSLEALAVHAVNRDIRLTSNVRGLHCSFSGQETQANRLLSQGIDREEVAFSVYECLARTIGKLIEKAAEMYGPLPVLLSGGVAGSGLLRTLLHAYTKQELFFAQDGLSSDNAVGVALTGMDRMKEDV